MTDALGWRAKFAVLIPSTNTSVQPEFDGMRPVGVTNHICRIRIPNMKLESDEDFAKLVEHIAAGQIEAVDSAMTCEPDRIVLGISVETFWGGYELSRQLKADLERHTGLAVSMGAEASEQALKRLGAKRIGVVTPYWPIGDRNVAQFFTEAGFEVERMVGLRCTSPVAIAHVGEAALRDAIGAADGPEIDAVIQVGTNLAMARIAAEAERRLAKPVVAINTAIYWHALRASGIDDKVAGWGQLLEDY
ncbi:MAG TPA: arylmalonate decarboxylase [Stellaceae bacterium]|nr:arylmalonate decarboxylase [Stellaceae bacterium]